MLSINSQRRCLWQCFSNLILFYWKCIINVIRFSPGSGVSIGFTTPQLSAYLKSLYAAARLNIGGIVGVMRAWLLTLESHLLDEWNLIIKMSFSVTTVCPLNWLPSKGISIAMILCRQAWEKFLIEGFFFFNKNRSTDRTL